MNDVPGELQICAAGGGENKAAISAAAPVCRLSLYGEVGKRLCGKAAVRAATRPPPQRRSNPAPSAIQESSFVYRDKRAFLLYLSACGILKSTNRNVGRCFLMNVKDKNGKKNSNSSGLAIGMCIGLSIGTAIGAATQNIGMWMPIGLGLGLALGAVFNHDEDSEDSKSDKKE